MDGSIAQKFKELDIASRPTLPADVQLEMLRKQRDRDEITIDILRTQLSAHAQSVQQSKFGTIFIPPLNSRGLPCGHCKKRGTHCHSHKGRIPLLKKEVHSPGVSSTIISLAPTVPGVNITVHVQPCNVEK